MNYKVIITGPVGSGKTTAVNSLTERNAMLTDAVVSDADLVTKRRKKTTTVAMDYDVVRLNDTDVIHVYGTPGQERFDFMWEILSQGAHGVILLLDNTRNYPFRDLKYYSNRFEKLIRSSKLVIGVTRFDEQQDPPIAAYQHWVKSLDLEADIVPIDARERDHVTKLFYKLLDMQTEEEETEEEASETELATADEELAEAVDSSVADDDSNAEADGTSAEETVEASSDTDSSEDKAENETEAKSDSEQEATPNDDNSNEDERTEVKAESSNEKAKSESNDDAVEATTTTEDTESASDNHDDATEEPEEEFDASAYEAEENIRLDESIIKEVAKVEHVTGVSLTSAMGELLDSTIDNEELNEFIAFLSGVTPEIENTLSRGKIGRIMLRSPHDDNLTIFVEDEKSLGVSSNRKKSVQALSQQIEDMLQWM